MYINRVRIKNYRNFGDPPFEMELKPFTLILGENNVGKTNLLNALGLVFSQELVMFRKRVLELDDFNYTSIRQFWGQLADSTIPSREVVFPEVEVTVTLIGMNEDQEAVVGDWFTSKDMTEAQVTYLFAPRPNFKKEEWVDQQRGRLSDAEALGQTNVSYEFPIDRYSYSIFGSGDPTNECDGYFLRMLKMEFLDALRDAQREMVASNEYRLLYRILSRREDANYEDIKRILLQLQAAMEVNENLVEVKQDVARLLELVSLQNSIGDNQIEFTFSSPNASEMLRKIGLRYGTDPVSIERNGMGRNNLLYIALVLSHLASRDGNGNETFFRLVTLEEPESHLHPHLQDHLARNIESVRTERDSSMQLLMTSHSTHIAARLSLSNSVLLYRENGSGQIKSHYILSGIDPRREKSSIGFLSRYLDATKSRMFFARKLILVEGYAEQILVPMFFEKYFNASMERMGCNIVNVQGVAFSHFLKIVRNGFFVRCLVLTDRDTSTQSSARADNLKREFETPGIIQIEITENDTFEMDLVMANKNGTGKQVMLDALSAIKPRTGLQLAQSTADRDLVISEFFDAMRDSKADFASTLVSVAETADFTIPEYICRGFRFLEAR